MRLEASGDFTEIELAFVRRVMESRADRNNNPTAFTSAIAEQAGLLIGIDYVLGDQFPDGAALWTAKLLGDDPVIVTIRVIDAVGFRVGGNPFAPRWTYINLPLDLWQELTVAQKTRVIGGMYQCEGGTAMKALFNLLSS